MVWVEGEDAAAATEGEVVTLINWGNIRITKVTRCCTWFCVISSSIVFFANRHVLDWFLDWLSSCYHRADYHFRGVKTFVVEQHYYPRRAWAATGIVVCLFFWVRSPGCHSTAFIAWIAFTQQVISFKSGRFYVLLLLILMFCQLCCRIKASKSKKLELARLLAIASCTRPLFKELYYSHVEPYCFHGKDSGLLCWLCETTPSHAACEPGVLLVTLQASSGSAGMLLTVSSI